jgi:hypothetical protein
VGPLTGLSVSLLALQLMGVGDMSIVLIMLPAALQGLITVYKGITLHRKNQQMKQELEEILKEMNKED